MNKTNNNGGNKPSRPVDALFPKAKIARDNKRCPFCDKPINPETDFRNDQSKKEFFISGLCQKCQDGVFGKD